VDFRDPAVPGRFYDGAVDPRELSDEQIAAMSGQQRRELISRLARPADQMLPPPGVLRRIRTVRLAIISGSAIALVPWTVYLAMTLPNRYVVDSWRTTWVGFDILLAAMLSATAVLGWLRRQLMILTAFASGVLLICDAWFDVMLTDDGGRTWSFAGLVLELPVAVFLIGGPLQMMRFMAARLWTADTHTPFWRVPLPRLDARRPWR
jgi:hypothetical protein